MSGHLFAEFFPVILSFQQLDGEVRLYKLELTAFLAFRAPYK